MEMKLSDCVSCGGEGYSNCCSGFVLENEQCSECSDNCSLVVTHRCNNCEAEMELKEERDCPFEDGTCTDCARYENL